MRSKKLVIGLLLLLAVVFTTGTFAYWANSVADDTQTQTETISIGKGDDVTTTVSFGPLSEDEYTLVPTGYEDGDTTFDSTTFTFPVQWDADENGAAGIVGDLTVSIVETDAAMTLGTLTSAEILAMFDFSISAPATLTEGAGTSNVVITVTFTNEPGSKAIYDQVASGTLSFDITFNVTPQ